MSGLIGWWPLNETSGSTARDLSGNENHGTLNGGVVQGVAGKAGLTSYSFDGSDDVIDVSKSFAAEFNSSSFSISAWIKADSNGRILDNRDESSGYVGFFLNINSGNLQMSIDDGSTSEIVLSGSVDVTDGDWHHVVAMRDNTTNNLRFFVDGKEDVDASYTDTSGGDVSGYGSISHNKNTEIAAEYLDSDGGYAAHLDATINDVRVYDRALTPQEVQNLYETGSGDYTTLSLSNGTDVGAVSRWKFDDDNNDTSTAEDFWGSNHGTVNGASYVSSGGIRNGAYEFNDSGDEIIVPNNSAFHGNGTGNFSVSAWVKPLSISDDQSNDRNTFAILRRAGTDPRVGWNISFNSRSELGFLMEDSNNNQVRPIYSRSSNFDLSSWYHVVALRDGSTGRLYVNGVEKASATTSGFGDISTSEELYIGQTNDTDSNYPDAFNGSVDDVRIYDKALSPHEVFELYQWGTRGRDMRKQLVNQR